MLEYKETSIFCHQLVEYNGKNFLLDASTMKPKLYYWGLPTEEITVEMMEVDKKKTRTDEAWVRLYARFETDCLLPADAEHASATHRSR